MLVDDLLQVAEEGLKEREVEDLRIGLTYTAVLLDDGSLGVAATQPDYPTGRSRCCDLAGKATRNSLETALLVRETNTIDVSAGLAAINAVLNRDATGDEGDLLDFLAISPGETVGMIGHFGPFVRRLEGNCTLQVFERTRFRENTYPDWPAEQLLPAADVVLITSSTLVNKTLDHLLCLCRPDARVALAGPSTPLFPGLFAEHGVDFLAGMRFHDPAAMLDIISRAGGTPSFSPCATKLTQRLQPVNER